MNMLIQRNHKDLIKYIQRQQGWTTWIKSNTLHHSCEDIINATDVYKIWGFHGPSNYKTVFWDVTILQNISSNLPD
jgi:hypothetical protein